MPTRRQERINHQLVAIVSNALRGLKDPGLERGLVTVTGAAVSPDLHEAQVFVSVLGDEEARNDVMEALARSSGLLRARVGRELTCKVTPRLEFELDRSQEQADFMSRLIAEARASDPHPTVDGTADA